MQEYSSEVLENADAELARLDASARHHAVRMDGRTFVWREWGSGPALVLIHGGHGSWMHWAKNVEPLARHFRVLAPNMAGFDDSDDFDCAPHDPMRWERLLDSLKMGVEQLVGDAPLGLVGFSFGGVVAGTLAPRLPHLQRLVLLGSGGHGTARREKERLLDWRAVTGRERQEALAQNLGVFMLSSREAIDPLALRIHTRSCERTRFRSKAISRDQRLAKAMQSLNVPVLLVWGEEDVTAEPAQAASALIQGHPDRQWHSVPRAGHWVQYEKADEINACLIDWFRQS
ncbi:alpha/beta fold hydrolase [Bordetella sp. 02P26C-1]|uniref:alpha/beta fold hydrolase n=1 Tax=Bordetella sp. 02P26C-1 TaxID=2683195 RepID=UPI001354845F|nr:alpha/beta hydrolase [Bordetella sp. 02P26C-1]MVW79823.1 alpha/beta fold hydrolase [Bordetella sp. 02P26C-1]